MISKLIEAAFAESQLRNEELHSRWIQISFKIGGQLPQSLLLLSVQQLGSLDLLVRSIEQERSGVLVESETALDTYAQSMFSEVWVCKAYEICRVLHNQAQCSPDTPAFEELYHDLRLLRVAIDKYQLAGDSGLKGNQPLILKKIPSQNDDEDLYTYSKDDPKRSHIMSMGYWQETGSLGWYATDIKNNKSYWLNRQNLSNRFLDIFDPLDQKKTA